MTFDEWSAAVIALGKIKIIIQRHISENGYDEMDALMQRILTVTNRPSVYDPFAGSGTTLRAAKDLGIKAVGVEMNERYCEIIAERLSQEVLLSGTF